MSVAFGIGRHELANASNYALRRVAAIGPAIAAALVTFATDIGHGASSTARLLVMAVGSVRCSQQAFCQQRGRSFAVGGATTATEVAAAAPAEIGQGRRQHQPDERGRAAPMIRSKSGWCSTSRGGIG